MLCNVGEMYEGYQTKDIYICILVGDTKYMLNTTNGKAKRHTAYIDNSLMVVDNSNIFDSIKILDL